MLLFIIIIVKAFFILDRILIHQYPVASEYRFMIWAMGATLASHAITFFGVSYFDQSSFFLYILFAAIESLRSNKDIKANERSVLN